MNGKRYWRWGVGSVLLIAGLIFLKSIWSILYPFAAALFLAYLLHPWVENWRARGFSHAVAIGLTYIMTAVLLGGIGGLVLPRLLEDIVSFLHELPYMLNESEKVLLSWQAYYMQPGMPDWLQALMISWLADGQAAILEWSRATLHSMFHVLRQGIGLLISPLLAYYILYDWQGIKQGIARWIPLRYESVMKRITEELDAAISGVVRGQLLTASIVGIAISGGLWFLHLPYAVLIGFLAAALDLIPYFGAIVGAVPAVLLGLKQSVETGVSVLVLFFIVHQLEGVVLQPRLIGKSVGLHPLSVIFCILTGAALGGVVGMFISVPLAAVGKVAWQLLRRMLV